MSNTATPGLSETTASPSKLAAAIRILPGILLLAIIGYAGKLTEHSIARYGKAHHLALPNIEYVLWAIVFGLLISNTIGVPRIFRPGVDTYEFWLKAGIVLLGVRFVLGDIFKLGGVSLACVAIELAVSIVLMTWLGRVFKLSPKLSSLLAIGSSICGVSAIIAAKGAIDADDEDSSYAIAAILSLGAVSLFAFPLIGHALHLSDHAYGLWTGLAVDNTAEATAAGALFSDAAGKIAVLAKTARNATIGFVVLAYAIYWASKSNTGRIEHKGLFLWQKFPKFVLGFLAVSLLATVGFLNKPQIKPFSLGVPSHLCRRGAANECPSTCQAGRETLSGWCYRRVRHRWNHTCTGCFRVATISTMRTLLSPYLTSPPQRTASS